MTAKASTKYKVSKKVVKRVIIQGGIVVSEED